MIAEGYNSFKNMGIENCLEAGTPDYYLAVNKARPDILSDVNRSQHRLYRESPDFIADLTNKWFKRTSFTTTLSKVEQKWLAEHDSITVGYLNDYLPYCTTDSDGNVTGVVKDIVPEIFKSLGFLNIKVSYKGYDNVTDLNEALHNHDVDVIFPVVSNYWITEMHDVVPSVPAVSSYFNVLYAGEYPDLANSKIAVSKRNGIMDDYRVVYSPNSKFTYYKNAYDCLDAVLDGKADAVFVSDLRTEYLLRSKDRYKDLNTAQLLNEGTLGFAGLQELLKFPERYHIRVLARDSKKNRKLLAPFADCIEIIWGDLCRYEDVLRGVCGSDIVLHTGGLVSPKADYLPEATRKINLGAAENIRDAVLAQGEKPGHPRVMQELFHVSCTNFCSKVQKKKKIHYLCSVFQEFTPSNKTYDNENSIDWIWQDGQDD